MNWEKFCDKLRQHRQCGAHETRPRGKPLISVSVGLNQEDIADSTDEALAMARRMLATEGQWLVDELRSIFPDELGPESWDVRQIAEKLNSKKLAARVVDFEGISLIWLKSTDGRQVVVKPSKAKKWAKRLAKGGAV